MEGSTFSERLRSLFNRTGGASPSSSYGSASTALRRPSDAIPSLTEEPRHSRGLEQFFLNYKERVGLSILDLGGANQENIQFLTGLGHQVTNRDVLRSIDNIFGSDPSAQSNAGGIEYFLDENFNFLPDAFDGILLWDTLQFMNAPLLNAAIDRIHFITTPKSYLASFFNATERIAEMPNYTFRILDDKTMKMNERGVRTSGQVFNNRNIEKAFTRFDSVKFFLTRDNLREVIVRR